MVNRAPPPTRSAAPARVLRLPKRAPRAAALTLALAALASAKPASASAFDVLGVGPAGIAEVGARAARATDGAAAFYNPAGLAMGRGVHVEIAPQLGISALTTQGDTVDLADPFGILIAADGTVPLTGIFEDRLRVGLALYIPPAGALHLLVEPATAPQFPYFANRTQRLVVQPALAVRILQGLAIGAGLDILGGVEGPADVRPGASGAPEPRISVDATNHATAHVGVRLDVADRVHLGATYRQEFAVPVSVATRADIGGISLTADVDIHQALFDPHTFVLAAAVDLDRLELELDASYSVWSAYKGPALGVRAVLPGAVLTSEPRQPLFRDVATVRAAASYALDVGRSSELLLRAGLGFEPTILTTAPQGSANFADGPKLFAGLGTTLALRGLLSRTLRLGAGLGLTTVLDTTTPKQACTALPCPPGSIVGPDAEAPSEGIENPGYPTLKSGGTLWTASLGIGVDL